jgi:hypothetical protein
MRKTLALCGAVLCFALAAAAQDNSAAPAAVSSATATAAPARASSFDLYPWQVGVNYVYTRFRSTTTFPMNGFNTSITRYLNDTFGVEGDVGAHFGTTPSTGGPGPFTAPSLKARLIFYGGGLHIAYRHNQRIEPWAHVLFGGAHFRFSQTGGPTASLTKLNNFALVGGGGADIKLGTRLAWRVQADFLGTRFFSTWQKNIQVQTGLVINF